MELNQILLIIIAVVAAVGGVSFTALITMGKRAIAEMRELSEAYKLAVADGVITDEEKAKMMDSMIVIIDEVSSIWKVLHNLYKEIMIIILRKRLDAK